jgi:hypothetical protein
MALPWAREEGGSEEIAIVPIQPGVRQTSARRSLAVGFVGTVDAPESSARIEEEGFVPSMRLW